MAKDTLGGVVLSKIGVTVIGKGQTTKLHVIEATAGCDLFDIEGQVNPLFR